MSRLIVTALIFVFVFIVLIYLLSKKDNKENVRGRLDRMAPEFNPNQAEADNFMANPETGFLEEKNEKSGMAVMGEQLLALTGGDADQVRKEKRLQFIQAGIDSPNAVGYYYFFRLVAMPLSILFAFYLYLTPTEGAMQLFNIGAMIGLPILAWYGPNIYLTNQKQKRQKVLQRSFPDTLDLILVCVESGLALDAALARVCKELGQAHPEMTDELNRTRMELTLLSDRGEALQNLAERTDMIAFRSLVAALLQTEKFGTSLTETLRVLSDDYRHTRLMAAENKAGKLPAMMTVPMITLMMPAFMIIILGPAMLQLSTVLGD